MSNVSVSPSLLDRLTDNDPDNIRESAYAAKISPRRIRDILKRDLGWLLATISLDEFEDLETRKLVRKSTLNYGIRDLSGVPEQNIAAYTVETATREAICNYEPRLDPSSVKVALIPHEDGEIRGIAKLEISGLINVPDAKGPIHLEARIDFETGDVVLVDG